MSFAMPKLDLSLLDSIDFSCLFGGDEKPKNIDRPNRRSTCVDNFGYKYVTVEKTKVENENNKDIYRYVFNIENPETTIVKVYVNKTYDLLEVRCIDSTNMMELTSSCACKIPNDVDVNSIEAVFTKPGRLVVRMLKEKNPAFTEIKIKNSK